MNAEKQRLIDLIDKKERKFAGVSDRVWAAAETRFQLSASADVLCEALLSEGFQIERGLCGMDDAFVATWGENGPVIGILGEYDALSSMSQVSGVTEKVATQEGGAGHGCGHNLLGAAALSASVALKDYLTEAGIPAVIKCFGCPAEESGSGKAYMARGGAFEGVDAFLTWHPMAETAVWGTSSLANYQVWFHFKGRSAHAAAAPHMGRSALDACELMNVGVNYLREHIIQEARVHYAYTDVGGGAPNVVQASASLLYFIRAPRSSQVKEIFERVVDVARGAALMTGTEMQVEWDSACSEYIVNEVLAEVMYKNMTDLGPVCFTDEEQALAATYQATVDPQAVNLAKAKLARAFMAQGAEAAAKIVEQPLVTEIVPYFITDAAMPGSTDVGDASWQAPTVQCTIGCYPTGTVAHSWQWVAMGQSSIVHKAIAQAGKVIALTALDIIKDPTLLDRAKKEWAGRLGGESYQCAIPKDVVPK